MNLRINILFILFIHYSVFSQSYEDLACKFEKGGFDSISQLSSQNKELIRYLRFKSRSAFKYRCDLKHLKDKKELIFIFDGTRAFEPKYFEVSKAISKINNDEEQYHPVLLDRKIKSNGSLWGKAPSAYSNAIYQVKLPKEKALLYFSHTHHRKAYRCIKKIKELNPNIKIKISGYSWGGNTAQKLANTLQRKNIEVEAMLTLDPVRKGALYLGSLKNLTSNKDSKFFKKNSNIKKYYNIFQKADEGSILGLIKIKGNYVQGADINLDIGKKCEPEMPEMKDVFHAHNGFFLCPEVLQMYRSFIAD